MKFALGRLDPATRERDSGTARIGPTLRPLPRDTSPAGGGERMGKRGTSGRHTPPSPRATVHGGVQLRSETSCVPRTKRGA